MTQEERMRRGEYSRACAHASPACGRCVAHRRGLVALRRDGLSLDDPALRRTLTRYLSAGRRLLRPG